MKCTSIHSKCDGEFKKALKPGHIECSTCGYRTKGELDTQVSKAEEPKAPKAKSTTATDKEN